MHAIKRVHLRSKGSIPDQKGPSQIKRVHLRSKGSISDQKGPSQIKERQHMLSQRRVFSMTLWHVHTHAHTHAHNAKIKHYVRYDYIIYIQVQWIKMNWGTTLLTLRLPFNFNDLWSSCRVTRDFVEAPRTKGLWRSSLCRSFALLNHLLQGTLMKHLEWKDSEGVRFVVALLCWTIAYKGLCWSTSNERTLKEFALS